MEDLFTLIFSVLLVGTNFITSPENLTIRFRIDSPTANPSHWDR